MHLSCLFHSSFNLILSFVGLNLCMGISVDSYVKKYSKFSTGANRGVNSRGSRREIERGGSR